jgi:glutamate dehydrogenase/leucine dehydrogenase
MIKHGTLAGFKDAEREELKNPKIFMEIKCDVLIPAAVEKSID